MLLTIGAVLFESALCAAAGRVVATRAGAVPHAARALLGPGPAARARTTRR